MGDIELPRVDFRGLKPFDHLALVPQWDVLTSWPKPYEEDTGLFGFHLIHTLSACTIGCGFDREDVV
ncbi:MAG: hypothetical protein HRT77_05455 [Halioglobus sp.]|nr:hypothetical protein [Halioglobus sp.]